MSSKKILTLFPYPLLDVHLIKDVGMVPYWIARNSHENARLVAPKTESASYPTAEQMIPELQLDLTSSASRLSRLKALVTHARSTHLLNLYFWGNETFALGLLYKALHPSGKIYVKTDLNSDDVRRLKNPKGTWLEKRFISIVDRVSAESTVTVDALRRAYPELSDRILKVPNGFDDRWLDTPENSIPDWKAKENLAITVGRIGLAEKDHETLLEALAHCDLGDWKFAFVGPILPAFQEKLDQFKLRFPEKAAALLTPGNVQDRDELAQWYRRAKVFVLSSKTESFGITLVEALCFSLRLLVSDQVTSAQDLIENGRWGQLHRSGDPSDLAQKLQGLFRDPELEAKTQGVAEKARSRYRWSKIVEPIVALL